MSNQILQRLGLSLPELPKGSVEALRLKILSSLPPSIPLLSIGVPPSLQGQNVVVFPAKEGIARGFTLVGTDKLKPGEIPPSTKEFLRENGIDLQEPVFVVGAESLGLTAPRQTIRLTVVRENGVIAVRPVRESIKPPPAVGFRFAAPPTPVEVAQTKRQEVSPTHRTPQDKGSHQAIPAPRDKKPVVPKVPPPPVKVPPIPPGNIPAPVPQIANDRWVFQDRSGFVAELRGDSEDNLQMVKGNVVARMYAQRSPEALKNYLGSKPSEIRFSLVGDAPQALKVPIPANGVRPFLEMIKEAEETLSAPDKPIQLEPSCQSDFSK